MSNQKADAKARGANGNPYAHLGDVELLSELKRITERFQKGDTIAAADLKRRAFLNELKRERRRIYQ